MRGRWSFETIYDDSDTYFRDLIVDLKSARSLVQFETYIFDPGILAERMVDTFIECRTRGVRVQVLVDGFGSPYFYDLYGKRLEEAGVEVRVFKSWKWLSRAFKGELRGLFAQLTYRISSFNRRNHRKVVIIDGDRAWVGSQNVSDHHLKEAYPNDYWGDTGMKVSGPGVDLLRKGFLRVFEGRLTKKTMRSELILINDGIRNRRRSNVRMLRLFKRSKKRIWIQTPYFVPIRRVVRELIRARERGVDVRIIVPQKNDVQIVKWMSLVVLQMLIDKGVRIFEYCPRFSHQKILQIDEEAYIGSTNLNHRSFIHDLEVQLAVTHEQNRTYLENKFLAELVHSVELKKDDLRFKSWLSWFISRTLFSLRYWS